MAILGKDIHASVSVALPTGGSVYSTFSVSAEAVDQVVVSVSPGSQDEEVDLNSSSLSSDIVALVVLANSYPSGLAYKIESSLNQLIHLRNAHFYLGTGQIEATSFVPNKLFLTNNSSRDITFTVLVARKANI